MVRTRTSSGLRTANPTPFAEGDWKPAILFVVGRGVLDLLHAFKALLSEETLIITAAQQAWPAGLLISYGVFFFFWRGNTNYKVIAQTEIGLRLPSFLPSPGAITERKQWLLNGNLLSSDPKGRSQPSGQTVKGASANSPGSPTSLLMTMGTAAPAPLLTWCKHTVCSSCHL